MITCMLLPATVVPLRSRPIVQWGDLVLHEAPIDALPHGDFYLVTHGAPLGAVVEATSPEGEPRVLPFETLVGHDVYEDVGTGGYAWAPNRRRRFLATVYAPAEAPIHVVFAAAKFAVAVPRSDAAPARAPMAEVRRALEPGDVGC
jgi:hypothetical protein